LHKCFGVTNPEAFALLSVDERPLWDQVSCANLKSKKRANAINALNLGNKKRYVQMIGYTAGWESMNFYINLP
jgi:hypothetical protein